MFNGTGRLKPRHFRVLIQPFWITLGVIAIWLGLRALHIHVPWKDANLSTNANVPNLGMMFSIVASFLFIKVINEDHEIHECVALDGEKGYARLKKELKKRIHPLAHMVVGVGGILMVFNYMTLPYLSVWSGIKDVGGTTFFLAMFWKTAVILDNPMSAPWIRDVIPKKWRERLEKEHKEESGC